MRFIRPFDVDAGLRLSIYPGRLNTREQILEAAWTLFGERGFEDVSVRDVTNAANVNLASISYHFGGKEGLIQETVKRCMNPINEYRMRLLEQAVQKHGGLENTPLREVVEAFMRPLVIPEECGVQSGLMLRLVARYLIEADYNIPAVSRALYTEAFQAFAGALSVHFPHLSVARIVKHIVFASGSVIYFHGLGRLAIQLSMADGNQAGGLDREEMLEDVVAFAIHGFSGKTSGSSEESESGA